MCDTISYDDGLSLKCSMSANLRAIMHLESNTGNKQTDDEQHRHRHTRQWQFTDSLNATINNALLLNLCVVVCHTYAVGRAAYGGLRFGANGLAICRISNHGWHHIRSIYLNHSCFRFISSAEANRRNCIGGTNIQANSERFVIVHMRRGCR